jgi:hypothetical protein
MMQWQGLLAALVLIATMQTAPAEESQSEGERNRGDAAENPAPEAQRGADEGGSPPAGTFTPSEQIGADSAVSFPVDI